MGDLRMVYILGLEIRTVLHALVCLGEQASFWMWQKSQSYLVISACKSSECYKKELKKLPSEICLPKDP